MWRDAMKKKLELFHEKVLTDRNAYLIIELIQDIHLWSILWEWTSRCPHKIFPSFQKSFSEEFENSMWFYILFKKQIA